MHALAESIEIEISKGNFWWVGDVIIILLCRRVSIYAALDTESWFMRLWRLTIQSSLVQKWMKCADWNAVYPWYVHGMEQGTRTLTAKHMTWLPCSCFCPNTELGVTRFFWSICWCTLYLGIVFVITIQITWYHFHRYLGTYVSRRGHLSSNAHTKILESPGVVDRVHRMRSEMLEFSRLLSAYKLFDPGMSVAMRWDDQIMRRTQPFVPLSCFLSTVSPPYLPQPVSCHPLMELTVSDARGNGWRVVGISFAMWFLPET